MNFHVYLDEDLGHQIEKLCQKTHRKRNSIIREALRLYLQQQKKAAWPESVLTYRGIEDFPPFESSRNEFSTEARQPFLD